MFVEVQGLPWQWFQSLLVTLGDVTATLVRQSNCALHNPRDVLFTYITFSVKEKPTSPLFNICCLVGSESLATDSSCGETLSVSSTPTSSNIGGLTESCVDLHKLCRDDIHRVWTTEPNSDAHTRSCVYSSYQQFQPVWLKQHPWLHYSQHVDGAFCHACTFLVLI